MPLIRIKEYIDTNKKTIEMGDCENKPIKSEPIMKNT